MRYMFLIYTDEKAREALSEEERQHGFERVHAVLQEAHRRGVFRGSDPLQSTATSTTIRSRDAKMIISDGPFAETKEQLGGYIILDCKDLDEALEWASKLPAPCGGAGCIEIRPIADFPEIGKAQ